MATERDDSHAKDMVTLFSSSNHDAEMEALSIQSVLQANGVESLIVGPSTIPVLEFEVQVAKEQAEEAERILAEARAAGPSAADEAEASSEEVL